MVGLREGHGRDAIEEMAGSKALGKARKESASKGTHGRNRLKANLNGGPPFQERGSIDRNAVPGELRACQ